MFRKNGPILILSGISGCLDALGFLGLERVFTANMTGNTVLFGLAIAQGDWSALLRSSLALVGFSLGGIGGTLLVAGNYERREKVWHPVVTRSLCIECCVILLFALIWLRFNPATSSAPVVDVLIALSALAMGQQSATMLSLGIPGITTTYISGTIATLMANTGRRIWLARRKPPPDALRSAVAEVEGQQPQRLVAVWPVYVIAAIISGYGVLHFSSVVAFLPFLAMVVVLLLLVFQPPEQRKS